MIDAPRAHFVDGLRVTALHLNHLQDSALAAASDLREIVGLGRIGIGLRLLVDGGARDADAAASRSRPTARGSGSTRTRP